MIVLWIAASITLIAGLGNIVKLARSGDAFPIQPVDWWTWFSALVGTPLGAALLAKMTWGA